MKREKVDYIKYRIEKSFEIFEDAKLLASNKSFVSSINRLYYSCFYAAHALLYKQNFEAHTHDGVRIKFFQEFINTGIIAKEFGDLYQDVYNCRIELDYKDFSEITENKVTTCIQRVEEFLHKIKQLINSP